jgi:hypothetical protein
MSMPKGDGEISAGAAKSNWLEETLRPLNFVATMRERRQIRRFCDESLKLYRQVEAQLPQSSQTERYARFIELRSGATQETVLTVMRRAEESFADWPAERPLNFQDVVQYLAVTDCLKIDIAVAGVRSRSVDFVIDIASHVIPRGL